MVSLYGLPGGVIYMMKSRCMLHACVNASVELTAPSARQ